jgi:AraC-like DNA-binding protein
VETLRRGEILIRDLKRDPSVLVDQPHHELHFYLPRGSLDAIADDCDARRIGDLHYAPGTPVADPVIAGLGLSMLHAFELPDQANTLFLDHLLQAVATHLAASFGGMQPGSRPRRGGLNPWQESRAKAIISANLGGELQIADLARECRISASHFQRAFRTSTGVAPHQWLLQRRVDEARTKLRDLRLSLADVALACGFADQSHFTRVFARFEGLSPGRWRRAHELGPHDLSADLPGEEDGAHDA